MNYYLDTEFIEDFKPRCLNLNRLRWEPRQHYISLISIGLTSEDGREYDAVSKDFDLKHVWNKYDLQLQEMGDPPRKIYWLRENVLRPIHEDLCRRLSSFDKTHYYHMFEPFTYKSLKTLINRYGKTNKQIAEEIQLFTSELGMECTDVLYDKKLIKTIDKVNQKKPPVFYGYYADYDWVVFCSLFGRMLDLPKGYPMYCRDLKQFMDNLELDKTWKDKNVPGDNEHHALADARWNKKLHKALQEFPAFLRQQ